MSDPKLIEHCARQPPCFEPTRDTQKRLKDRVDQLERETALCQAREKSLKENTDKEKAKWNLERQETRKQLLALQGKDTQYLVRRHAHYTRRVLVSPGSK